MNCSMEGFKPNFKADLRPLWSMVGVLAACVPMAVLAELAPDTASGRSLTVLRVTELRTDKLASAPVLQTLPAGAMLSLISLEGGWALVQALTTNNPASPKAAGWVRASTVSMQADTSVAAGLASGREAGGNTALTLGVRSVPPRVNRHALIIGISRYADPATPPLPGARIDKQSATQMAEAMQVPSANIRYLQDEQATGDSIRSALQDLTDKVQDGDRVFIHFSGHGTRYNDPAVGGCVEALLAYDGGNSGTITNSEMAGMLNNITNKADKLFVMYDACHSGGVAQAASSVRTRGIFNDNDEGVLRPKFASISEECGRPVNVKTRNLVVEAQAKGALSQDIIHLSASRNNEISFDDEQKGGLATQFMRDCMLREAKDLDNSGAITIDEIKTCAQAKVNSRMANDVNYKAHNLVLNGNAEFVPSWFGQSNAVTTAESVAAVAAVAPVEVPAAPVKPGFWSFFGSGTTASPAATAPVAAAPVAPPVATTVAPPTALPTPPIPVVVAAITGEQALRQMFDQRDAKRRVQVTLGKDKLKIGQDTLDFSVKSDRAGFVYVAMAGSDNKAMYLLFPNDLDQNNKIGAGQTLALPRPTWRVKAGGPVGNDNLLVMVTDGPRDISSLAANKAGPFVTSLNDASGRAQLGALMTTSKMASNAACASSSTRQKAVSCSDAYGASMVVVEEIK